jgi:CDP-diacylglycerol--serine O-phosphatidyltransferase
VINLHPPIVLFGMFCAYGLSGYVVYALAHGSRASLSA